MSDNTPSYLKIAAELRDKIRTGTDGYQPGDQIPGEHAIARQYGVARNTARQAVSRLQMENLVTTVRAYGTFVRRTPPVRRLTTHRFDKAVREQGRGAYDVEMRALGFNGRTTWLFLGAGPCPGDDGVGGQVPTNELLGVEPGTQVMVRSRLMFAAPVNAVGRFEEEVMQIATSYVPWDIAERNDRIQSEDTGVGGLYSRIEDAGHLPEEATERIRVRVGTARECELLRMDDASLVMTIDRWVRDPGSGRVVEVCRHVAPPTNYEIQYEFKIR